MDTGAYLNSVFGLKGKVMLITGAAGGIGNAISRGLAAAGGTVALCGRNLEKCRALMDEITAMAVSLPEHTVVPYTNVPKKQYPKNIPLEVWSDEETAG